jgi:hypothetical protein
MDMPHQSFIWPESEISVVDVVEELEVVDNLDGEGSYAQQGRNEVNPCNNFARFGRANGSAVIEEWSYLEPGYPVMDPR